MYYLWQSSLIVTNTVIALLGVGLLRAPVALPPSPPLTWPAVHQLDQITSFAELQALRDRLQAEWDTLQAQSSPSVSHTSQQLMLTQALQTVDIKIHLEKAAFNQLKAAHAEAAAAIAAGQLTNFGTPDVKQLKTAETHWKAAIDLLANIPDDTLIASQVHQTQADYQRSLAYTAHRVDLAQSSSMAQIASQIADPSRVRITVCQVDTQDCRYWLGDRPPASAASLIKVPIAIALIEKLNRDNLTLDTKIRVTSSNYTEDPSGSNIFPNRDYTLRELLLRMIDHSSNVATNQLIDFIGFDAINQTLQLRGYTGTVVGSKLVGESTYPANMGPGRNILTTNDLTQMMIDIYSQKYEGYNAILDALVRQYDWDLGYAGIQKTDAAWIGEKTGQNSYVLGTTTAVNVGGMNGERYIISLTVDYTAHEPTIRQGIQAIVEHIIQDETF